jgi:hypothetical protein
MYAEMVIVRGKVRLVSPRLRNSVQESGVRWNSLRVEDRGHWFTGLNMPGLHEETGRVLGAEYRLAGRSVSL